MNTPDNLITTQIAHGPQLNTLGFRHSFANALKGTYSRVFKSKDIASKDFTKSFNLPIIQSAAAFPIAYAALLENDYGIFPVMNKLMMSLPSYSEWPLFFTTLRIVVNSVTS